MSIFNKNSRKSSLQKFLFLFKKNYKTIPIIYMLKKNIFVFFESLFIYHHNTYQICIFLKHI